MIIFIDDSGGGGDPYWANVVSLLHFDGADASTTFTDETGKTWAASGNAQIDTAESKFGGASGLFDGNDVISTPSSTGFDFDSGAFTVECWIRPANVTGFKNIIRRSIAADYATFTLALDGNKLRSRCATIVDAWYVDMTGAVEISASAWTHIALVRNGPTFTQYVDGVADGTVGGDQALLSGPVALYVGAQSDTASGFSGHIDEVRITKGIARYTSDFTPPTAAFPNS